MCNFSVKHCTLFYLLIIWFIKSYRWIISLGVENLDSGVGIYAPDAESYTLFAPIFNPIIEDYHEGFKPSDKHPATDFGDINTLVDVDPTGKFVVSTRVRCGRSLQGYAFNPCLTEAVSTVKFKYIVF